MLTKALLTARFFDGNLAPARRYMRQHWGAKALNKSGFARQLHRLHEPLKALNTQARYVIDLPPVAICDNVRIQRCRLLQGAAYRGYAARPASSTTSAAARCGLTHDGLPVEFCVHAGSEADITGLEAMSPQLPAGSVLYAAAAYTDYTWEDAWREAEVVALWADRKAQSKRPHEPWQNFLIQHSRKGVETTISQSTERFSYPSTPSLSTALPLQSRFSSSPIPWPS